MRTDQEILDRIEVARKRDVLGLAISDLVECLSYGAAMDLGFLKDDTTEERWEKVRESSDPKEVKKRLVSYLDFAFGKALGHRGISASRSVLHIINWLWLMGDDDALAFAENDSNYCNYGVPILKHVSERYGFDYPRSEAIENMSKGLPCGIGDCECGE